MSIAINRMQLLRGDFSGRDALLRPPWALAEEAFTSSCNRCGDCIEACPTHILEKGRGGFPVVDFSHGECLFCGDRVGVCIPRALQKSSTKIPWSFKASIDADTCIAFHGVECRSCIDPCEPRAIRMRPRVGGVTLPDINLSACTGCGACFAPCPVQALRIQPLRREETA